MINNKVDFLMTIEVKNANPNGDPLTSNMPRIDSLGYGIISDAVSYTHLTLPTICSV